MNGQELCEIFHKVICSSDLSKFNELQKKIVVKLCWIFHYLFSITYLKSCFHCKWLNSNTGTDNACKNR